MESPLVSVIIPNYNHARFLDERIQSVLNQTYQNLEVIILDDKSTDNSVEVINQYKDNPHISQIIINEKNSGSPFIQWNKGFELAKGDIIWIAESDDSCSPFFLERLIPLHLKSDAVFSFCRSQRMDESGRLYRTWHNEVVASFTMKGGEFIERYLGKYNLVTNASSVIFNKKDACEIDPQYISYRGAGDWLFWIELAQSGDVAFCDEALNYFREHTENTTRKCFENGQDYYEGKLIYDYLVINNLISKQTATFNKKEHLNHILYRTFENEQIRRGLLKTWNYNIKSRIIYFISRIFCKADRLLWRLL